MKTGFICPWRSAGARQPAGRVVDDFINVRDFAPTFLAAAGLSPPAQMSGHSFLDILTSNKSGQVDAERTVMLIGKERHDLGRPHDWGYPVRAIRTPEYLFVHTFEPDRWPACNPETGLGNCDNGPTKTLLIETGGRYYDLAFGKRPAEELYLIADDPECMHNLATDSRHQENLRVAVATGRHASRRSRPSHIGARSDLRYLQVSRRSQEPWLRRVVRDTRSEQLNPSRQPAKTYTY